ncbi:hypothetical protein C1645_830679 [Glomus cerebriforme]|uniref:Uncharacterized protein n=1 Tax=Glomus cerebriforme TaxID=658196 RepID=A0A397SRR0_9GLOM|nr:hypothetical protein C1645_830679 [Glomus cerebriforme]
MYENLKQKISNELSARVIKIVNDLDTQNNIPEIEKRPLYDQIFTKLNDKLIAKVDIYISDVNSFFTAEFGRIYAEINSKLIAEAEKNKAYDDDFTRKAQKIFSMVNNITTKVNNIEEAFQRSNFDQRSVSNESETNSSLSSSSSSGSSQKFISVIRKQFTDIFDRIKGANDYSLDQMCAIVLVDILSRLGMGVIGKDTIKGFYCGENLNSKNLEKIGA